MLLFLNSMQLLSFLSLPPSLPHRTVPFLPDGRKATSSDNPMIYISYCSSFFHPFVLNLSRSILRHPHFPHQSSHPGITRAKSEEKKLRVVFFMLLREVMSRYFPTIICRLAIISALLLTRETNSMYKVFVCFIYAWMGLGWNEMNWQVLQLMLSKSD